MVDIAPNRDYNEVTVKGNTKTVPRNGAEDKTECGQHRPAYEPQAESAMRKATSEPNKDTQEGIMNTYVTLRAVGDTLEQTRAEVEKHNKKNWRRPLQQDAFDVMEVEIAWFYEREVKKAGTTK